MDYEIFKLARKAIDMASGIKLEDQDNVRLWFYLERFEEDFRRNQIDGAWLSEAINRFLFNYYDLDSRELNKRDRTVINQNGRLTYDSGADFFLTPEFRNYCGEKVSQWRDEIELV